MSKTGQWAMEEHEKALEEISKGWKSGELTAADVQKKLVKLGYSDADQNPHQLSEMLSELISEPQDVT